MSEACDVVVIGAGAMGAATAWWLARRGRDVLVIEQFEAGHRHGASHGGSRIFRLAYPDPHYVRMAQAALPLWHELSDEAGEQLLLTSGGVDHGSASSVDGVVRALDSCGVARDVIGADEAMERWPGMRFSGSVCLQPDGGCVRADASVRALHACARAHGAQLRWREPVEQIKCVGDGVLVTTANSNVRARIAVVACGAWTTRALGQLVDLPPLKITQEQVFHFESSAATAQWPAFIHHRAPVMYGLETPEEGVKVAEHHRGTPLDDPETRTYEADPKARRRVQRYVRDWLPGLVPEPISDMTCLYTTTPTEDFVIDRKGPLIVAAGFSGHGFKFTPVIGRMLADLADGSSGPIPRFALPA